MISSRYSALSSSPALLCFSTLAISAMNSRVVYKVRSVSISIRSSGSMIRLALEFNFDECTSRTDSSNLHEDYSTVVFVSTITHSSTLFHRLEKLKGQIPGYVR